MSNAQMQQLKQLLMSLPNTSKPEQSGSVFCLLPVIDKMKRAYQKS
jgi:hypothetical protein